MNTKKTIFIGIAVLFTLIIGSVLLVAVSIGGEASNVKTAMETVVHNHTPMADVKAQLASLGFTIAPASTEAELNSEGSHHSALVYKTWLTVKVGFDAEGKANHYDMQRADGWF